MVGWGPMRTRRRDAGRRSFYEAGRDATRSRAGSCVGAHPLTASHEDHTAPEGLSFRSGPQDKSSSPTRGVAWENEGSKAGVGFGAARGPIETRQDQK